MDYKIDASMLQGEIVPPNFGGGVKGAKRAALKDLAALMEKHQLTKINIHIDPFEFFAWNRYTGKEDNAQEEETSN